MPDVVAAVTLKSRGVYHPPGSVVAIGDPSEAERLVERGDATWPPDTAPPDAQPVAALPADIPGRAAFEDAGLTLDEVAELEDPTEIEGIGPATAAKLRKWLSAGED